MRYLEAMCSMTGYRPLNKEMWLCLCLEEGYNPDDLPNLVERLFDDVKKNYKGITELVMFLNWKIWENHESGNDYVARIYNDLWEKYDGWVFDNLNEDEIHYFLSVTD